MKKQYNEVYDTEIDKYLLKRLNAVDKEKFEQLLSSDTTLAAEVEFRKGLLKAMKWKRQINLAHTHMLKKKEAITAPLETARKPFIEEKTPPIRRMGIRRILAYAASLSLLVMVGLPWFATTNYSDQQLAIVHAKGLVSLDEGNLKGGNADTKNPFEQGIQSLKEKEYQRAATFFEGIPAQQESYAKARLYLAFSQFQSKEYEAVIKNAEITIQNSIDTKDRQKAEWLMIQAKLAQGKTDANFNTQLNNIATNQTHIYRQQAQQLQKRLTSFWRKLVF